MSSTTSRTRGSLGLIGLLGAILFTAPAMYAQDGEAALLNRVGPPTHAPAVGEAPFPVTSGAQALLGRRGPALGGTAPSSELARSDTLAQLIDEARALLVRAAAIQARGGFAVKPE